MQKINLFSKMTIITIDLLAHSYLQIQSFRVGLNTSKEGQTSQFAC